jgi:hypothetical protein
MVLFDGAKDRGGIVIGCDGVVAEKDSESEASAGLISMLSNRKIIIFSAANLKIITTISCPFIFSA